MNSQDQEKLFKLVRKRFKNWTVKKASGYVHGVNDCLEEREPFPAYALGMITSAYATGYRFGFVDAYGSDALLKWELPASIPADYRWWANAIK